MTPFDVYVYKSAALPDARLGLVTCLVYHVESRTPIAEFRSVDMAVAFAQAANAHPGLVQNVNQLDWELQSAQYKAAIESQRPRPSGGSWFQYGKAQSWSPDQNIQLFIQEGASGSTPQAGSANQGGSTVGGAAPSDSATQQDLEQPVTQPADSQADAATNGDSSTS